MQWDNDPSTIAIIEQLCVSGTQEEKMALWGLYKQASNMGHFLYMAKTMQTIALKKKQAEADEKAKQEEALKQPAMKPNEIKRINASSNTTFINNTLQRLRKNK